MPAPCCAIPRSGEVADCLGLNVDIDVSQVRDVIVVGAGPSGWQPRFMRRPKASTCWW